MVIAISTEPTASVRRLADEFAFMPDLTDLADRTEEGAEAQTAARSPFPAGPISLVGGSKA